MTREIHHKLFARLFPLLIMMGLGFATPALAGGSYQNTQGDNSQGDNAQGNDGQGFGGPAIPEPSAWLAMGAGFLLVAPYLRSRSRTRR
jgi:hypothetical protein